MIYKIKLIDGGGDNITYTGVFETTRKISLKKIKELYDEIREKWFDNDGYCSLQEYLTEKLASHKIMFYIDEPNYDDTWWF